MCYNYKPLILSTDTVTTQPPNHSDCEHVLPTITKPIILKHTLHSAALDSVTLYLGHLSLRTATAQ